MTQESPYVLRFTPTDQDPVDMVLDGDLVSAPPSFETSQRIHESEGFGSDWAYFRPLGGAICTVIFEVEVPAADRNANANAFLSRSTSGVTGSLKMGTIINPTLFDAWWQSTHCLLRRSRPLAPLSGRPLTRRELTFICALGTTLGS